MGRRAPVELLTHGPEETMDMAAAASDLCRPNDVIALEGTLGAGKTCFVKGLARGMGVGDHRRVISPTFVLLREYHGRLCVYHFDAYRLGDAAQMEAIGCAEVFDAGGVSVVEWADRVAGCLPERCLRLRIEVVGPTDRRFLLEGLSAELDGRLEQFRRALRPWLA